MLWTFSFGCFQIYQNKSTKNIAVHFIGITIPIKCMPKISAVGLFCLDKFENNQTRTCTTFFQTSKLTEVYFNLYSTLGFQENIFTHSEFPIIINLYIYFRSFDHLCIFLNYTDNLLHNSSCRAT